jgi:hypothetical protein
LVNKRKFDDSDSDQTLVQDYAFESPVQFQDKLQAALKSQRVSALKLDKLATHAKPQFEKVGGYSHQTPIRGSQLSAHSSAAKTLVFKRKCVKQAQTKFTPHVGAN